MGVPSRHQGIGGKWRANTCAAARSVGGRLVSACIAAKRAALTDSSGLFFGKCPPAHHNNAGLQQIRDTFVARDLLYPPAFPTQSLQTNTLA